MPNGTSKHQAMLQALSGQGKVRDQITSLLEVYSLNKIYIVYNANVNYYKNLKQVHVPIFFDFFSLCLKEFCKLQQEKRFILPILI